jgi:hypothetical protein
MLRCSLSFALSKDFPCDPDTATLLVLLGACEPKHDTGSIVAIHTSLGRLETYLILAGSVKGLQKINVYGGFWGGLGVCGRYSYATLVGGEPWFGVAIATPGWLVVIPWFVSLPAGVGGEPLVLVAIATPRWLVVTVGL